VFYFFLNKNKNKKQQMFSKAALQQKSVAGCLLIAVTASAVVGALIACQKDPHPVQAKTVQEAVLVELERIPRLSAHSSRLRSLLLLSVSPERDAEIHECMHDARRVAADTHTFTAGFFPHWAYLLTSG
jgi:7-keto-8-aminopelargonate synthetase-like enzyme